jgi:type III secretory pathway component EscS
MLYKLQLQPAKLPFGVRIVVDFTTLVTTLTYLSHEAAE